MDRIELYRAEFKVSHRHNDGSWSQLEAEPSHHDPAAHDSERQFPAGRVYRCRTCEEEVVVSPAEESSTDSGRR